MHSWCLLVHSCCCCWRGGCLPGWAMERTTRAATTRGSGTSSAARPSFRRGWVTGTCAHISDSASSRAPSVSSSARTFCRTCCIGTDVRLLFAMYETRAREMMEMCQHILVQICFAEIVVRAFFCSFWYVLHENTKNDIAQHTHLSTYPYARDSDPSCDAAT